MPRLLTNVNPVEMHGQQGLASVVLRDQLNPVAHGVPCGCADIALRHTPRLFRGRGKKMIIACWPHQEPVTLRETLRAFPGLVGGQLDWKGGVV